MQPHRTFFLRWASGALLLIVALLGVHVDAAASRAGVMPQIAAATEAVLQPAPAMGDCVPCAYCYAGPAPTAHGLSGQFKEQAAPTWAALAPAAARSQRHVGSEAKQPQLVPLRIAYSRWNK